MKIVENLKNQSKVFHTQSQGSTCRSNSVLAEEGSDELGWMVSVHRLCVKHAGHSATAHALWIVFGHPSSLRSVVRNDPSPPCSYDDYVSELKPRIQTALQGTKDKLLGNKIEARTTMTREQMWWKLKWEIKFYFSMRQYGRVDLEN